MTALAAPFPVERRVHDAVAARMLFRELANLPLEQCGFAYLDPQWRVLGTRYTHVGDSTGCPVPIRDVVADVLAYDACGVVMAHNHPAGDPTPSAADIAVTRRLIAVLNGIDVRLVDHVVLAGDRWASMRGMGLL